LVDVNRSLFAAGNSFGFVTESVFPVPSTGDIGHRWLGGAASVVAALHKNGQENEAENDSAHYEG
jgi:hypothetical protein